MPPEPPLPAVVLARAVVADVEAQAAEPVAVVPVDLVQLRSPQFLVQALLLELPARVEAELPLVLVAARLRLAEVALLAAVVKVAEVAAVDVTVAVVVLPLQPVDSGPQVSSMEIINLLLAAGVSPNSELNARRPEAGSGGRFADPLLSSGTTPLLLALVGNKPDVAKVLLDKGANPNIYGMGISPWLYASGLTVGFLIQAEAAPPAGGGGGAPSIRSFWI